LVIVKPASLTWQFFLFFFLFSLFTADFGFVVECDKGKTEVEGPAYPVGSTCYLPPEVLAGAFPHIRERAPGVPMPPIRPVNVMFSNKTDVWAVGVIAAELVCGAHPYQVVPTAKLTVPQAQDQVSLFFLFLFPVLFFFFFASDTRLITIPHPVDVFVLKVLQVGMLERRRRHQVGAQGVGP
jgi:serine/threonine protein kinase